jgi:hypothetical protein
VLGQRSRGAAPRWRSEGAALLLAGLLRPHLLTPEQGAATSVWLASSPAVEGVTGGYFKSCRAARSSRVTHDVALARRLWDVSAELTGVSGRG